MSIPCGVRTIFLIRARVPMEKSCSGAGCSALASRWDTTTSVFSSPAKAASTAATEPARPTDSGRNRFGNSTVFLIGNTGSVHTADAVAVVLAVVVAVASAIALTPGGYAPPTFHDDVPPELRHYRDRRAE